MKPSPQLPDLPAPEHEAHPEGRSEGQQEGRPEGGHDEHPDRHNQHGRTHRHPVVQDPDAAPHAPPDRHPQTAAPPDDDGPTRTPAPLSQRVLWTLLAIAAVLLVISGIGLAVMFDRYDDLKRKAGAPTASAPPAGAPGGGAPAIGVPESVGAATAPTVPASGCEYVATPNVPQEHRSVAKPNARPSLPARSTAEIRTNVGAIKVELLADAAPCTVNSFLSLVRERFFANSPCHRLTTDAIYVLQCGDPSGTGQGGPGYRYGDENLPAGHTPTYPRGTLAMANAGPGTNGSQFFLVYKDSEIDPNYTVFGTITSGLDVLDQLAATGTDDSNGPGDGHPQQEVVIDEIVAA